MQRHRPDHQTNWDVTSDSIALELARRLNAERLVLVKSCEIDPKSSVVELAEAGIVDRRFASLTVGAAFPIDFVHHAELARVRALLLGEARPIDD